jgi:plastocyanin
MRALRACFVVAVFALLALGASAQAATRTIFAGPAGKAHGTFGGESAADLDTFSVPKTTIHVGDRIRFILNGVHSVTFNKKGAGRFPFVINGSSTVQGINDAAGSPFWFNGLPQLVADPRGALPQGGKTYNGSALTGSGVATPGGPAPKPYVLKFTKAGTFKYFCVVHPGMNGTVRVVPKRKRIPSATAFARATQRNLAKWAKAARKLAKYTPPANTIAGGHDKGGVVQLRFFPSSIHVPVGGTVNFAVTSKYEIHTASFGDPAYLNQASDGIITPVAAGAGPPTLNFSALVAYPSDPPPALPPYTGTQHGNGFLSTGILDNDRATPSPTTSRITFNKAGTYQFVCLVHPFMKASVVVG